MVLHHTQLDTSFTGVVHLISTPETPIHQFRGIKYASVPARFRQSTLFSSYSSLTDATKYGYVKYEFFRLSKLTENIFRPICPQVKCTSIEEELFGLQDSEIPRQVFKQNEFECLNLNITCPGRLTPESRLPVMLWIHGYEPSPFSCVGAIISHAYGSYDVVGETVGLVPVGCMMEAL